MCYPYVWPMQMPTQHAELKRHIAAPFPRIKLRSECINTKWFCSCFIENCGTPKWLFTTAMRLWINSVLSLHNATAFFSSNLQQRCALLVLYCCFETRPCSAWLGLKWVSTSIKIFISAIITHRPSSAIFLCPLINAFYVDPLLLTLLHTSCSALSLFRQQQR